MKTYIKPTSEIIILTPESMLAASAGDPQVIDQVSEGDMYSQKKGWNSSLWSDHLDEEE